MFTPELGHFNNLLILEENDLGLILDGGDNFGNILLPKRYMPDSHKVGERIKIFLYLDSDDRPIATTESPKAVAGEFAYLKVLIQPSRFIS